MSNFFRLIFAAIFFVKSSVVFAALPFVTDDAALSNKNQLLLETYLENWQLPRKSSNNSTNLLGQYLGFSYGVLKNLEISSGALAAYDFGDHATSFSNPFLQIKSIVFSSKTPEVPQIAISGGYVNKSGRGQYYDTATNIYLMGISTSKFFDDDLIIHVNSGLKSSYNIDREKNLQRLQLGIGFDLAILRKDFRLVVESYNGAPNSPRDSPGFFHSYQCGLKWVKSPNVSFNILYGSQPTFVGYDDNNDAFHRRTTWVQFGIRKAIDDFF